LLAAEAFELAVPAAGVGGAAPPPHATVSSAAPQKAVTKAFRRTLITRPLSKAKTGDKTPFYQGHSCRPAERKKGRKLMLPARRLTWTIDD
jgi:hypothetical protein